MTQSDWCHQSLLWLVFLFAYFSAVGRLALHSIFVYFLCYKLLVKGRKSNIVSEPKSCLTSKAEHMITSLSLQSKQSWQTGRGRRDKINFSFTWMQIKVCSSRHIAP